MRQEKINYKAGKIIFWCLVAVCMAVIFYFSSRTAAESSAQSSAILEWIYKIFGDNMFTDFLIRKTAHCLEFTGLCILMNSALYFTYKNKKLLLSVVLTSAYAISDEVHQIFVEGRSCELRDWGIDTAGAVLGMLAFVIIFALLDKILEKKRLT